MALFQNSLGFLPPYFGSGLKDRTFGFIKSVFAGGTTYIVGSGGSVSRDGDYLVHTFTASDTFQVIQKSNKSAFNSIQYLIVAGGGGGGFLVGGGGGAGGLRTSTTPAIVGS